MLSLFMFIVLTEISFFSREEKSLDAWSLSDAENLDGTSLEEHPEVMKKQI